MANPVVEWHDFYVMAGGALAALTGLLFVAMSIHLHEILALRKLTQNVGVALYGMLSQLLFCGMMLAPGVTLREAGIGILVIGSLFTVGYVKFGNPRNAIDLVTNAGMGVLGAVIGGVLLAGYASALYLYAVVLGVAVFALVRLCWLLLTMAMTGLGENPPVNRDRRAATP